MTAVGLALGLVGCQGHAEQLSQSTSELVIVSPATDDFGSVQVGSTAGPLTITVAPAAGANDDTISSITYSCPDFTISAPGLPAEVYRTCEPTGCEDVALGGGSQHAKIQMCPPQETPYLSPNIACITDEYVTYQFTATFHPTIAAPESCVVSVNTASPRMVTLTGTGTPPPIHVGVSPGSVAFGDVRRNTASGPAGITVGNSGGSTATISSVSVSAGFAITAGTTTAYTLGPNASMGYNVTCNPTALGALGGSFVVASNDPVSPSISIPLSCNGIDSVIDIEPSPGVLPATRVGAPITLNMTIGNSGNVGSTIEAVAVTGDLTLMSGPPASTTLGAGATTPVVVAYAAAAAGSASGTLVVTYDGGQMRTTQLSGVALATSLSLDPDGDVDFGPVCIGQTATQMFTLIANSDGPFLLQDVSTSGDPFTVTPPTLPASLKGDAANNAQFTVTATPTDTGEVTQTVTLTTDIPDGMPHVVTVDVTGLTAGVSATPDLLDFGSNPIDTTTVGQQVQLSNCSTAPITASNPTITGVDATEFAVVASPPAPGIAPTALASWLIVFSGHTAGIKNATFSVDYDGGTATVPLTAEVLSSTPGGGSGSDGGGDTGKDTYYACSAGGGPLGLAPLLLVMFVVVRTRRR